MLKTILEKLQESEQDFTRSLLLFFLICHIVVVRWNNSTHDFATMSVTLRRMCYVFAGFATRKKLRRQLCSHVSSSGFCSVYLWANHASNSSCWWWSADLLCCQVENSEQRYRNPQVIASAARVVVCRTALLASSSLRFRLVHTHAGRTHHVRPIAKQQAFTGVPNRAPGDVHLCLNFKMSFLLFMSRKSAQSKSCSTQWKIKSTEFSAKLASLQTPGLF